MKTGKIIAWVLGLGLLSWVVIAFIAFAHDAPSRKYAETSTTTPVVQSHDSGLGYFFWGYMMGGGFGHSQTVIYRDTANNSYRSSPEYQAQEAQSGSWGPSKSSWSSDNESGSWGSSDDDSSGSWGSGWSSSDDSGSWGGDSSWSSSESSGSWGGSDSSWSSSNSSGSWGD